MSLLKLIHGRWGSGAAEVDAIRIDAASNAFPVLTYEHHKIHDGSSFVAHIDNTTANNDLHRTLIGFETPNTTKWLHMIMRAAVSSPAEIFLVEDVTIDDDEGAQIVALDRNRNTANTSTILSLQATPTVGSLTWMNETQLGGATFSYATVLDHIQLAAGVGPKAVGVAARGDEEWILKQGIKYALFIQNIGAAANLHEIHLGWYEHASLH